MKSTVLLLVLCLATPVFSAESSEPAPCCPAEKPVPKEAACCAAAPDGAVANPSHGEIPADVFTRESLYQADATFTDDAGQPFALGSLRGRPVVLAMFFASCNYACPLIIADITRVRDSLPATLRDRAQLVLISFDVARDTPAALNKYRAQRLLDAQWILLHGDDDAVRELAALLGVKFKQEADGQFSHSNLVSILNAEGEIVHQRSGLQGGLEEAAAALKALQ